MSNYFVVSSDVTVGQLTFILRAVIQIVAFFGLTATGYLIVAHAPSAAPITVHDVVNRQMSYQTAFSSSGKWVLSKIFGRSRNGPTVSTNLVAAVGFSMFFTLFVSLSDLGFLGFFSCNVPGPVYYERPASVGSIQNARDVIASNLINGTDPSTVQRFSCSSVEVFTRGDGNITLGACTDWRNTTYAADDLSSFQLNTTDTDVLMPRMLSKNARPFSGGYENRFITSFATQLNTTADIVNGMAIDPSQNGLTVIFGVPHLRPEHKVELKNAMALEMDVACINTGLVTSKVVDSGDPSVDSWVEDFDLRFFGPEYMRDALNQTVGQIRDYYRDYYAQFPVINGIRTSNFSQTRVSPAAAVRQYSLDRPINSTETNSTLSTPTNEILRNCTTALQSALGLPTSFNRTSATPGYACSLYSYGGSVLGSAELAVGLQKYVCATTTMINMVNAEVSMEVNGTVRTSVTRVPSDLHTTWADYYSESDDGQDDVFNVMEPYIRFTLSENPQGATEHYIQSRYGFGSFSRTGAGSSGGIITLLENAVNNWINGLSDTGYGALPLLSEGFDRITLQSGTRITAQWIARLAASFVRTNLGFNGVAALDLAPVEVLSTGGKIGTCYHSAYGAGFLPLVFGVIVLAVWMLLLLFTKSLGQTRHLKGAYAGMIPYAGAVCPDNAKDTMLSWQVGYDAHGDRSLHVLRPLHKHEPIHGEPNSTAVQQFSAPMHSDPSTP